MGERKFTDDLTRGIIACVIKVHNALGPGFVEDIYRRALIIELEQQGFAIETEKTVVVRYEGREVGRHRLDLLVNQQVIIELKAVEQLAAAHYAQLRSYLKATSLTVGLLVNFGREKADTRRVELNPSPPHLHPFIPTSP